MQSDLVLKYLRSLLVLLMPVVITCTAAQPKKLLPAKESQKTSFFVSIDGLQPDLLQALKKDGHLKAPQGLGWMLENSMVSAEASPVITSLTAASHVSTVTCSPPSRHGIIGNAFLKDGKKVNGFEEAFTTEPLWRAAMRQGKTVLTLGYVGTDGTSESRTASLSLSYPLEKLLGPSQTVEWNLAKLSPAQGWTLPKDLTENQDLKESSVTFVLNPLTQEKRLLDVLIQPLPQGRAKIYFALSKNLERDQVGILDTSDPSHPLQNFFFVEESWDSSLRGVKRRVFARALKAGPETVKIYFSKVSYNQAYPEQFREALDKENMVWPDYGVRDPSLSLGEWLEAQSLIDRFLVDVGGKALSLYNIDLIFFYQPLIDSLGHKAQNKLPQPFLSSNQDEVTKAFVRAFEIVDQNLSRLFKIPASGGIQMVMGDHGMDPIHKALNVAPLLPKDHLSHVEVFSSGDLLLVYPLLSAEDKPKALEKAYEVGEFLKAKLMETRGEKGAVLGFAHKRQDFSPSPTDDYQKEWQYGEAAWAFAASAGYWFQYQPLVPDLWLTSTAGGMHGKDSEHPHMLTMFMAKGENIPEKNLGPMNLIQAVPTFSHFWGIQPPRDCLGKPLVP